MSQLHILPPERFCGSFPAWSIWISIYRYMLIPVPSTVLEPSSISARYYDGNVREVGYACFAPLLDVPQLDREFLFKAK